MSDSVRPIDSSPPSSPVPGILQARTLEWVAISFSNAWKCKVKVKLLSRARLSATPGTAAYQAPPSMGFSRQEYWSGVPCSMLEIFNILIWVIVTLYMCVHVCTYMCVYTRYMYIIYTYVKTHQVVFFKMCAVYSLKVIPQLKKKKNKRGTLTSHSHSNKKQQLYVTILKKNKRKQNISNYTL